MIPSSVTDITKKEIRKLIKQKLHAATVADITAQSQNVFESLLKIPEYKSASTIACYLHMDQHEIETDLIINKSFEQGKRVFLPRIVDLPKEHHGVLFKTHKKGMKMLEMPSVKDIASIKPHGAYQLREPPIENTDALSDPSIGLDLIIVPGLGFTKKCHRIGHGKGFYDTYINQCNKWSLENNRNRPLLIGIGAEQQLVDHIPLEEHDMHLDILIINGQVYKYNPQA